MTCLASGFRDEFLGWLSILSLDGRPAEVPQIPLPLSLCTGAVRGPSSCYCMSRESLR